MNRSIKSLEKGQAPLDTQWSLHSAGLFLLLLGCVVSGVYETAATTCNSEMSNGLFLLLLP